MLLPLARTVLIPFSTLARELSEPSGLSTLIQHIGSLSIANSVTNNGPRGRRITISGGLVRAAHCSFAVRVVGQQISFANLERMSNGNIRELYSFNARHPRPTSGRLECLVGSFKSSLDQSLAKYQAIIRGRVSNLPRDRA
ncbi:hypothetical protein C8R47DRAFT_1157437 [Mycena vitilis]|nr:hypothetical protein C8R47DRAFT_1157437 [Mycena vitilis]